MSVASIPGTISARVVHRVVEFCRARGHDAESLCRSAGVTLSSLAEPDARVPYATAQRLGDRALVLTGDENFGLHLAQDVGDSRHYDAGLLLLMASPTVRVALERMVALQRYWGDGERATLHPAPLGRCVRYVLAGATGAYARHSYECALAEVALGVRALSGQDLKARVVRFAHRAPAVTVEHDDVFGCPVEFGAVHAEIEFDDSVLDSRMLHANEAFCGIFEQQVQRALSLLPSPGSASGRVREVARAALSGGACTLGDTAEALGVSVRTLQRRLHEEGTSFAEVVDALRRETAVAYLERRIPIPEVAALLGYSDATAFHHAFSRWTGSSPLRYAAPPAELRERSEPAERRGEGPREPTPPGAELRERSEPAERRGSGREASRGGKAPVNESEPAERRGSGREASRGGKAPVNESEPAERRGSGREASRGGKAPVNESEPAERRGSGREASRGGKAPVNESEPAERRGEQSR